MGLYNMRADKDTLLFRIASVAYNCGLTPNKVTAVGLCFGVTSGILLVFRELPFALLFGCLNVFCDVLDGTIARKFHMETAFGKVFDSVGDRTSEIVVVGIKI
jgi:phosphatidylglycerophosphate synthase